MSSDRVSTPSLASSNTLTAVNCLLAEAMSKRVRASIGTPNSTDASPAHPTSTTAPSR